MKKYIFPALVTAGFIICGIYAKILANRCDELREKQARQESILLKQSEILAVNTAMLHILAASQANKKTKRSTGKEGFRLNAMP